MVCRMTLITWHERFATHDTGNAALYLPEGDLVEATLPHVDSPTRNLRLLEVLRRCGIDRRVDWAMPAAA
jgi:hypothetical protein